MTLSRREGVDIRPTLLRVLTDLYVQTSAHSADEERQFVELTSRLIDQVDDATRAAVRARLAIYPATPAEIMDKLGLRRSPARRSACRSRPRFPPAPTSAPAVKAADRSAAADGIQPVDAAQRRRRNQRHVLRGRRQRARADPAQSRRHAAESLGADSRRPRRARASISLEMAAFAEDIENFTLELGEALILPSADCRRRWSTIPVASRWPAPRARWTCRAPRSSACCCSSIPNSASSVHNVYRLSRLYDRLSERSALVMLAAWRGSTMAVDPRQIPRRALRRRTPSRARGTCANPPRRAARNCAGRSHRHRRFEALAPVS